MFGFYDIYPILREMSEMEARLRMALFEGEHRARWERKSLRKRGRVKKILLPVSIHRKMMCHNPRDAR